MAELLLCLLVLVAALLLPDGILLAPLRPGDLLVLPSTGVELLLAPLLLGDLIILLTGGVLLGDLPLIVRDELHLGLLPRETLLGVLCLSLWDLLLVLFVLLLLADLRVDLLPGDCPEPQSQL